jgi:hypothetical protein
VFSSDGSVMDRKNNLKMSWSTVQFQMQISSEACDTPAGMTTTLHPFNASPICSMPVAAETFIDLTEQSKSFELVSKNGS